MFLQVFEIIGYEIFKIDTKFIETFIFIFDNIDHLRENEFYIWKYENSENLYQNELKMVVQACPNQNLPGWNE